MARARDPRLLRHRVRRAPRSPSAAAARRVGGFPLLKTEELGGVNTRYHGAFIPPVDAHDHLRFRDGRRSQHADHARRFRRDLADARRPHRRDPAGDHDHQHGAAAPSTHGVLRLLLELDGETVIRCTPVIGYLHTGIEKNTEYRTWMQGVTYVTRADYLALPQRAQVLPRGRAAARHRGSSGPGDPGADERAEPHLVAPRVARDRGHGARRRERDALRLPRARGAARHLRGNDRPAHEPRVHPHRRRDHGSDG